MYIADNTWPDLSEYVAEESVALVPLGSTEQHGPHLPLATDHVIAEGLARAAADRAGFLCTPTVNVGVSEHHRQFHGTMWVSPTAFREYVESFTRNLTYHGIDRVVFVNAHGGNSQHLTEVARRLRGDGVAFATPWMWDESIPELVDNLFETNGPHAGPKETSMLLHLDPETVKPEEFENARDDGLTDLSSGGHTRHGARVHYDAIENADNGAFGDQTDASAEKGEQLFEAAFDQLVHLAEWLDEQRFADLLPRDHVDPQPRSRRGE
ncbi:MAG: creatininase family protein [Halolamina sp.]|uniref:creatininase family protein n=1 Tax=Halolamina sp. TaxID=1940283 RepID=UPI002FC2C378